MNDRKSIYAPTAPDLAAQVEEALSGDTVVEALRRARADIRAGAAVLTPVAPLQGVAERIAERPVTSRAELLRVVQAEPALAARLLHLANTRYRDLRRPPLGSIDRAVDIVGPHQLKQLITEMANPPENHPCWPTTRHELRKLWTNALFSAMAAREVAETTQLVDPELVYTCALLHNAGESYLMASIAERTPRGTDFRVTERIEEALRIHHAALGAELLESWTAPRSLRELARRHHEPLGVAGLDPALHALVLVGWLAAMDYGYAYLDYEPDTDVLIAACDVLGCKPSLIGQVTRKIGPALNEALSLSL